MGPYGDHGDAEYLASRDVVSLRFRGVVNQTQATRLRDLPRRPREITCRDFRTNAPSKNLRYRAEETLIFLDVSPACPSVVTGETR